MGAFGGPRCGAPPTSVSQNEQRQLSRKTSATRLIPAKWNAHAALRNQRSKVITVSPASVGPNLAKSDVSRPNVAEFAPGPSLVDVGKKRLNSEARLADCGLNWIEFGRIRCRSGGALGFRGVWVYNFDPTPAGCGPNFANLGQILSTGAFRRSGCDCIRLAIGQFLAGLDLHAENLPRPSFRNASWPGAIWGSTVSGTRRASTKGWPKSVSRASVVTESCSNMVSQLGVNQFAAMRA